MDGSGAPFVLSPSKHERPDWLRSPFDKLRVNGAALLLVASLLGCATIYNPATGHQETVLNSSLEIALGNVAKAQMGLTSLRVGRVDPEQLSRVQGIGQRLARTSDRQDVPYQFGVVREKSINAFTLPGGTIYVHTGLVEKANDDELAAVLAHEVGHVAARHAAKHLQADLGFTVLTQIAGAAGVGPGSAQLAESLYGLFRNGYSRQDELEADRLGIRYTLRAGYDPEGMITFFEKMLAEEPEDPLARSLVWQQTHPLTTERIAQAKKEIEQLQGTMFCTVCGSTYGPKEKFCVKDGTLLKHRISQSDSTQRERFCPQCGATYPPKTRFCVRDGTRLEVQRP